MSKDVTQELVAISERVCELARSKGADAEALIRDGSELTAKIRMGEPELVKEASSRALGLRVFVDRRAAVTHTSDLSDEALEKFVADTVELAQLAEPDELNTLPETFANDVPELELWDERVLGIDAATALAVCKRCEEAALGADDRVVNTDGATYSRTAGTVAFANSAGFSGGYRGTYASFYVEPICDDEGGKKRNGYWWTASRFVESLEDPEAVGRIAAERTVSMLGARKVPTCEVPVIFDAEAGRGLLSDFYGVANGGAFYRRSSYLLGREGTPVASELVSIVDDPLLPRAPGSRPFDGEGLSSRKNVVVRRGVLETILCDVYSARKLGRESTGSAGRGVGGSPGPTTTNFIFENGHTPPGEIIKGTDKGLLVMSMMGFGFNPVTGDFSRGASGFWIENGEIAYPVSEVTISANFDELWKGIDRVGNDLTLRSSVACPTFRVARMTVAGR